MVRTLLRGWRVHVLAIVVYGLLALILTWPLAAHFGTHVPGDGVDDPPLTWNLWWVGHALLAERTNPFYSTHIFYPLGINLALYTLTVLNGLLSVPLQAVLGLVPASNVLLLSSFVLSGYGAFRLVSAILAQLAASGRTSLGAHPAREDRPTLNVQPSTFNLSSRPALLASLTAGLIYAFASNKLFYAALGQWNIASSQWIPFYVLCLVRLEQEPRRGRTVVLAALFLLFQAYAEMTYASFLVLFTVLWAAWPRRGQPWAVALRPAVAIGLLFAIGLAPVLAAMIPDMLAGSGVLTEGGGFADVFSADLLGFLVPTVHHPLLGSLVQRFHFDHSVGQHLYPGYAVLALAAIGVVWGRRGSGGGIRGAGFWLVSAVLFWLLTLGPTLRVNGQSTGLPLPFALVSRLPFFEANRYPSRYGVMLMLSLAVLAGWGLAALLARARRARLPVVLLLVPLIVFEHLAVPLPLSDMRVPAAYEAVAARAGEGALLEVPLAWRNGARVTGTRDAIIMFVEYYQAAHGKPLLGGNTSRNPPFKFQYFTEAPVLNTLIALETGHAVDAGQLELDRQAAPQVLRFFNIDAVVVHPGEVSTETLRYVENVLPVRRLAEGGDAQAIAYETDLPPWPSTWQVRPDDELSRLSYAEGWSAPAGDVAWAQRRAVRLLMPAGGAARHMRFRAYAPEDGQRLEIAANGTRLRVPMHAGWQDYDVDLGTALHTGLNDVWLRFDRLYPAAAAGLAPRPIGRTGVQAPANIVVESAGEEVGDFGHVYVNGQDVGANERGYNLVVLDPQTGAVKQSAAFDTHLEPAASQALAAAIAAIPAGDVVAVAAADEASRLLGPEAVDALRTIGAAGDLRDRFRWGHAVLGVKGAVPGTALEAMDWMRPVRIVCGDPLIEPRFAAAFGPITFGP